MNQIIQAILQYLAQHQILPPANTTRLNKALFDLKSLLPKEKETEMTEPTGQVQIAQSDLDTFAAEFEAVKTALAAYIAQLVAGQGTPLPAADEAGLTKALADLDALEPPS